MRVQTGGFRIHPKNGALFDKMKAILQRNPFGDPHIDYLGIFLGGRGKKNFLIRRFPFSWHSDDLTFPMCRNRNFFSQAIGSFQGRQGEKQ
jgi:hypothetical protein